MADPDVLPVLNPPRVLPRALLMLLAVVALYLQTYGHGFVNYDDPTYVSANPVVAGGLTPDGLAWALGTTEGGNWHPLTWLSHMLDVTLFGLDPGPHHLVSAALHAINAALLLACLHALTGELRPSLLAAALFAVHPQRVESVAWIAERKDLLAGTFWMLTLAAYVAWVRRRGGARYVLLVGCFAAGLMAKPMLVTLPFVLLLLDAWPLGRLDRRRWGRRVAEKLPLFALAAAASAWTWIAQAGAGSMRLAATWPWPSRLANAALSCVAYLGDMLWPAGLACFYPHPASHAGPAFLVLGGLAATALAAVTVAAIRARERRPFVAVGWLWFLGTLVPVLGLIQVGAQGRADRYTYLPSIGIAVAVAWTIERAARGRRWPFALAFVPLAAFAAASWVQTATWRDSRTLWLHAIDVTPANAVARTNLGAVYDRDGDPEAAVEQFEAALAAEPEFPQALNNLGLIALRRGDNESAVGWFERATEAWPDYAEAQANLGSALRRLGFPALARERFERALELDPDQPVAHNEVGLILERQGRLGAAIEHYEAAIAAAPASADPRINLGNALLGGGDLDAAREQYETALRLEPDRAEGHNNLAYVLARSGDVTGAVSHYRRALELQPDMAAAVDGLAWLLATYPEEAGR